MRKQGFIEIVLLVAGLLNIIGYVNFHNMPTYLVGTERWVGLLVGSICLLFYYISVTGEDKH